METRGNSFSNGQSYGGGPDIPKLYRQGPVRRAMEMTTTFWDLL